MLQFHVSYILLREAFESNYITEFNRHSSHVVGTPNVARYPLNFEFFVFGLRFKNIFIKYIKL